MPNYGCVDRAAANQSTIREHAIGGSASNAWFAGFRYRKNDRHGPSNRNPNIEPSNQKVANHCKVSRNIWNTNSQRRTRASLNNHHNRGKNSWRKQERYMLSHFWRPSQLDEKTDRSTRNERYGENEMPLQLIAGQRRYDRRKREKYERSLS